MKIILIKNSIMQGKEANRLNDILGKDYIIILCDIEQNVEVIEL